MGSESIVFSIFLIFSGAAVVSSFALFTRQPLIVGYIVLGALFGPYGLDLVSDSNTLEQISHIGIVFLLFLLGLDLQPRNFGKLIGRSAIVTITSGLVLCLIGTSISHALGMQWIESVLIGVSLMFSSTIIGIKLLPTTMLHHKRTGEVIITILLIQDGLAIVTLVLLSGTDHFDDLTAWLGVAIALPALMLGARYAVRWVILPLLMKFDRFHEYIFLLAIGWCLGLAELSQALGLSLEIGAFIAGVSLANSPIAQYIAVNLKPLRDFFLILFFFSIGAGFDLGLIKEIWLGAVLLTLAVLILKPYLHAKLLITLGEPKSMSWEAGFRLGQTSEFSLLIAFIASSQGLIGVVASHVIQATTILTFLISTYIVVFRYPTPIAVSDRLRRD
ncbi:cation:proton antiporter [Ketobacter sp. MCCC 1A13808]|uniref:cation:proton antiporter domain-containing protein n=1 Tax=Ketobacter sp. MCCC 1A13808 TaxID=2602738 RepID=UPI0012EC0C75|nr:cation:proton antiporter [Ketobacter sp. MCCC 1A13808]MVF12419.1 cation:proton antiporter [Ketobacter sp. MCCC 1A13808]